MYRSAILEKSETGSGFTLKNARACGCCRFISLKAGLSTLCARYLRAFATDFFAARLAGAFLGFISYDTVQEHLNSMAFYQALSVGSRSLQPDTCAKADLGEMQ